MEVEIAVTLADGSGQGAKVVGKGEDIFNLKFTASGDGKVLRAIKTVFDRDLRGYNGHEGSWKGRIGGSLPRLEDALTQLSTDQADQPAVLQWNYLRPPLEDDLPSVVEEEGVIY